MYNVCIYKYTFKYQPLLDLKQQDTWISHFAEFRPGGSSVISD